MALRSDIVTVTAPTMRGIWVHDPWDPEGTIAQFRFHDARGQEDTVEGQQLTYAGRTYPVWHFGQGETRAVTVTLVVPFREDDWAGKLAAVDAFIRGRAARLYRDGRGRLIYGVAAAVSYVDIGIGTTVDITVNATDFDITEFYAAVAQAMAVAEGGP